MAKILNYGSLNIDHVYKVDHIVVPGETLESESLSFFAGGKGANQSVAIAKAGAEVYHAGKIGSDGTWLLDTLASSRVNTDFVKVYDGHTGHAIIQVNKEGENSIILYGGGNQAIRREEVDTALAGFGKNDYLVLQNEINEIPYIIKKAHDRGLSICLNPAPFSERIKTWPLELVTTLIMNETEAAGLAGLSPVYSPRDGDTEEQRKEKLEAVIDTLAGCYPGTDLVLTAGGQGAFFAGSTQREYVPSVKTTVVDTTAAGDTFLGYYLVARISGKGPREAMEQAARAASISVSRPGAMESIPWAAELSEERAVSAIPSD
jgi:ribokinase